MAYGHMVIEASQEGKVEISVMLKSIVINQVVKHGEMHAISDQS